MQWIDLEYGIYIDSNFKINENLWLIPLRNY